MEKYKEIRGLIKVINSIFRNSPKIEHKGIKIPISKEAGRREIVEWSKEIDDVVQDVLENNDLVEFREFMLRDCSCKLDEYYN